MRLPAPGLCSLLCTGLLLGACNRAPPAVALVAVATPATSSAAPAGAVAFLTDDWESARKDAAASGKLLFVDAWAPWCHTCISMEREVLRDPSLARFTARFVFARVDTDRPENVAFTTRYAMSAWPTFFVIDPTSRAVLASRGGALSLRELTTLLDHSATSSIEGKAAPADRALAAGYALLAKKDSAAAATQFVAAVHEGGPRTAEAVQAAMSAYEEAGDFGGCVDLGAVEAVKLTGTAASADVIAQWLSCVAALNANDPRVATAKAAATRRLETLIVTPPKGVSVDDRADAMRMLAERYEEDHRPDDARALHEKRLQMLTEDARMARTPEAARVQDYQRMQGLLALGRGDEAVQLFTERTTQLPQSYEAFARLASTLHKLRRDVEAKPAAIKAIELSYGPRRLNYVRLLADIEGALNNVAGQRAALEQLLTDNAALPEALRREALAKEARALLAQMDAAPPKPTAPPQPVAAQPAAR